MALSRWSHRPREQQCVRESPVPSVLCWEVCSTCLAPRMSITDALVRAPFFKVLSDPSWCNHVHVHSHKCPRLVNKLLGHPADQVRRKYQEIKERWVRYQQVTHTLLLRAHSSSRERE